MSQWWRTGAVWNAGTVLNPAALRANMAYCAAVTRNRTADQARTAFIYDRQDQSYAMIGGLGPLRDPYLAGSLAVTSITTAPDTTPPTTISDGVPAGAPAGAATGAGSVTSELGAVVTLVNTVRGNWSSGNPCKLTYQYPRPWRMTLDSTVVDTGTLDAYGFPVYDSPVIVAPQLLRQRGTNPATDGGYLSGHTNAFFLAGLALAYAIPERFQELLTRAFELADTRIVAGMHSPADVIGGRVLATALAAAILADPANAAVKAAAREQALTALTARTGTGADTLNAYAHRADPGTDADAGTDPYADRDRNARALAQRFSYGLPRTGPGTPMVVPSGAEVLLETRLPYLDDAQRREVLRTTALPGGVAVLDGPELWGRLNVFAAADGYAAFDADVRVVMDAAGHGFHAADTWRNDITGRGALTKLGTGTLTLTGTNRYAGGTVVAAGTLVAGSAQALGRGGVRVDAGTLRPAASSVRVRGDYTQTGGTLAVTLPAHGDAALLVEGDVTLGTGSTLVITLDPARIPSPGATLPVIHADRLRGRFATVTVTTPGWRAEPLYRRDLLSARVVRG
jgi:autotransporter-associated beta strand protein